jgi:hypothetical protein
MGRIKLLVPLLVLFLITLSIELYFQDLFIKGGLNKKDSSLITVLGVVCYFTGWITAKLK